MQVVIRPLQLQDAYTSVVWRNDPEVFKYTGNTYDHEITIESELVWIKNVIANNNSGKEYRCAIEADGVYVGNIYLTDLDSGIGHYHIFIGNKDYWGKGIARKASEQIIKDGFYKFNLKEIQLRVHRVNTNALNLYKRLGFVVKEESEEWISMNISYENLLVLKSFS